MSTDQNRANSEAEQRLLCQESQNETEYSDVLGACTIMGDSFDSFCSLDVLIFLRLILLGR
jgi:hypothetical protein